jgi:hypothetical protein
VVKTYAKLCWETINEGMIKGKQRDSHAKGIAAELQYNLHKKFVVQGTVKLGSELSSILNISIKDMTNLTINDVVVVWGGGV